MCVSDNEWCESVGVSLCDCEDGGVCFHISDSALYVAQPPVPAMPYFHFIRLSLSLASPLSWVFTLHVFAMLRAATFI